MTADQRPGSQLKTILHTLRTRPLSSWQVGERVSAMRAALQQLADLAAAAADDCPAAPSDSTSGPDGSAGASCVSVREVPDLGVAVLPDQLEVLARDAIDAGVGDDWVNSILAELAATLSIRR